LYQKRPVDSDERLPGRPNKPRRDWLGLLGLRGKTLWDLLGLLIVPIVIALAGWWLSEVSTRNQQQVEADRARQSVLQSYIQDMTALLLDKGLATSKPDSLITQVARANTLSAIHRLDSGRNRILLGFLSDSNLLSRESVALLRGAKLDGADLRGAKLDGADLSDTDLRGADLSDTDLRDAKLDGADLRGAKLDGADLSDTDLRGADLRGAYISDPLGAILRLDPTAKLTRADLREANLTRADLTGADLREANLSNDDKISLIQFNFGANLTRAELPDVDLSNANLTNANLSNVKLDGADMRGADLSNANLSSAHTRDHVGIIIRSIYIKIGANLAGTNLASTNLSNANLSYTNLSGADGWTNRQLAKAESLAGATLPDGRYLTKEDWEKFKRKYR
jgi:uncharacterized protein YjbI with pentapeptide repeats